MGLMEAAGLKPRIDAAGNISARRAGSDSTLAPVLFGSHIDSVPSGGNFDGDLGSLAAIEVVQTLNEAGIATRRPLEVVVWSNEEGVAYNNGSDGQPRRRGPPGPGRAGHWCGTASRRPMPSARSAAIRTASPRPRRKPGSFHCYLELHIEQGGTLDHAGIPIGVVEGIVAIDRYDVEIRGFANHAGTTPMPERRDALLAASYLTVAVNEIVRARAGAAGGHGGTDCGEPQRAQCGAGTGGADRRIARPLVGEDRQAGGADSRAGRARSPPQTRPKSRCGRRRITPKRWPIREVQASIEAVCARLGLKTRRLPSGAGHDAQMMATLGPMGMIFVPSVGGISHAPKEFSRWEDCARGADVLLETVLEWAK